MSTSSPVQTYNPNEAENKWYSYWEENNCFKSTPDDRPAYTIVIPPPNVTGILHMGHMLNNTIQDVLIRRARMTGKNACWVPGTDHASIATEAKVVARLKEKGINKSEITREEFLQHAWHWKEEFGDTILKQLKKLGCSCDWSRTRFTMEDDLSKQVIKAFIKLHKEGLIYRGKRIINWDPEAQTNISDEEVIYKEITSELYHLHYVAEDGTPGLVVATTRPETIFADVALCVNPTDERYTEWIGKKVHIPISGKLIPIISDEYVDKDFGTGVLKITPAHHVNDYALGEKYGLPIISCIDKKGKLTDIAGEFSGQDRFLARKNIRKKLEEIGLLLTITQYPGSIGTSERTGSVIEPMISKQWFLQMEKFALDAQKAVDNGEVKFHPEKYINTFRHWMENIRDWNISRQLWWGQQIPAYYIKNTDEYVVAESLEEALDIAKEKNTDISLSHEDLHQDEDVLDTWFSSWLWPFSVFNGLNDPNNPDFLYYYPTQDLVTGPDIIFFWVARMIMAGQHFTGKAPFKDVYFTGIVRDAQRRKMSKSLGNSPDPLELIDKYGADSVRVGILMSSAAGNDLLFDEDLMLQGRNFGTKIWNAYRLISGWETEEISMKSHEKYASDWFLERMNVVYEEVIEHFTAYRISDALKSIYSLIWDDFCAWYLELIKPGFQQKISVETKKQAVQFLEKLMEILHPFMPFLTEEIWQTLSKRTPGESIMLHQIQIPEYNGKSLLNEFQTLKSLTTAVRNIRQKAGISPREELQLITTNEPETDVFSLEKLSGIRLIISEKKPEGFSESFVNGIVEYHIPMTQKIDVEEELRKAIEALEYQKGFLQSVQKKLSNEKFVAGAPEAVISAERKKEADALEKITLFTAKINELKSLQKE